MPSTMRKPSTLLTIALTLAAVASGGALVAAAVVYGGLYNVASTAQHLQPTFTAVSYTHLTLPTNREV